MDVVFLEGNRLGDLNGNWPDVNRRADVLECRDEFAVERSHGHRFERDGSTTGARGFNDQNVVDEIEVDLQTALVVPHGRWGDAANGGGERDSPAVINGRHES